MNGRITVPDSLDDVHADELRLLHVTRKQTLSRAAIGLWVTTATTIIVSAWVLALTWQPVTSDRILNAVFVTVSVEVMAAIMVSLVASDTDD